MHIALQRELGRYQQTYPQAWKQKTDAMRTLHERVDGEMKRGVKERALRPEDREQLGAVDADAVATDPTADVAMPTHAMH